MKRFLFAALCLVGAGAEAAEPQVSLSGSPTLSSDGVVTVAYTLSGAPAIMMADVQTNRGDGVFASAGAAANRALYGDIRKYRATGSYVVKWDPALAGGALTDVDAASVRIDVQAWATNAPPDYLVVDLLKTGDVTFYLTVGELPGSVNDLVYKTQKLVMRKIPAKEVRWKMGSPDGETGRAVKYETPHWVTLSEDYYLGVYPVTIGQCRSAGISIASSVVGRAEPDSSERPINGYNYNAVRGLSANGSGYDWPSDGHAVDSGSHLGKFRANCGGALAFDFPTSAQWEYACRAGTATAWNNGSNTDVDEVAWYDGNLVTTSLSWPVGRKRPNNWGLYDMHGLHREFCLDRFITAYTLPVSDAEVRDPLGVDGTNPETSDGDRTHVRINRGGHYRASATETRSAAWDIQTVDHTHSQYGYRLCCPALYCGIQ